MDLLAHYRFEPRCDGALQRQPAPRVETVYEPAMLRPARSYDFNGDRSLQLAVEGFEYQSKATLADQPYNFVMCKSSE